MGLKIISGFVIPSRASRRSGQAFLNLTTGQFRTSGAFKVLDHRVTGSGRFVRRPHVTLSLRRIGLFVESIGSRGDSLDYDLGDTFHQFAGPSPELLEINWAVLRRIDGSPMQKIAQDAIREISYLVIGETDEPVVSSFALIADVKQRSTPKKRAAAATRKKKATGK